MNIKHYYISPHFLLIHFDNCFGSSHLEYFRIKHIITNKDEYNILPTASDCKVKQLVAFVRFYSVILTN